MREFKREYPIESQDFDDNVEALKEYNTFLEKILKDNYSSCSTTYVVYLSCTLRYAGCFFDYDADDLGI